MDNNQKIKILLVEDDVMDQIAIQRAFDEEKLPYDLECAESITTAKKRLEQGGIDLILLDQTLPDGSGLEFQEQSGGIPIIFLTGSANIYTAVQAMKCGAFDFLIKDITQDYLLLLPVTIEKALQRKQDEAELELYRENLEKEVRLRTVELQKTNQQLQQEITERKKAEEALREHSEQLEEMVAERTKDLQDAQERLIRQERLAVLGELAGGVSHELRNPLGVITNAIYYLNLIIPDANPDVKKSLDLIENSSQQANRIVTDLLDFGRITAGEPKPVKIPDLLRTVMEQKPAPENVTVRVDIPEDLPSIFVDHLQIKQVLANLLTNAYQSMPQGGTVMLESYELPAEEFETPKAAICIKDTGAGIPPEIIDKIFEPLFTTKAKGIGLGLAISKNLVEVNMGKIDVESKIGEGSIFKLYLPMDETKE